MSEAVTNASGEASGPEPTIPLLTSDQQRFDIPRKLAFYSKLIKNKYEDESADMDEVFPLSVNSATLTRIIEFLTMYEKRPMWEIEKPLRSNNMKELVQDWYADFVTSKNDHDAVYDMLEAAHFLDIPPLLELTCAFTASLIKGHTPEQIRAHFNIVSDFTPEEQAWLREENKWALEDK